MAIETEQPASAVQSIEGKYVYCIIESKEPRSFGPIGIGARGDGRFLERDRVREPAVGEDVVNRHPASIPAAVRPPGPGPVPGR